MHLALALGALVAAAAIASASAAADAPLIPRTAFFGNPAKAAGRISPDGRWLSWMAARNGVLNVWVAPLAEPGEGRALTDEKGRPVASYSWAPDSSMILYATDDGGDENYQLYGVDVATGERRALTHFAKTRVGINSISHSITERILIDANNRDPQYFDLLSLDLKTGAITTVVENDGGFAGFLTDDGLVARMALKTLPSGDVAVYRITGGKVEGKPFDTIPYEDAGTTQPASFTYDGKTLYWIDSRGRDTSALIAEDVATGARTVLGQDKRADITRLAASETTGKIEAFGSEYLRNDWTFLDPGFGEDFKWLQARLKGDIAITSRTRADDKWTVTENAGEAPPATWLFDRKTRALTKLFSTRPELEGKPLALMHPIEIKSRDGLMLVSYLSLPPDSDPKGEGRPSHPLPMVLFPHGGPWARDSYGYNGYHQWLANRGYAVLSVNFRASTGFGKRFTAAGDKEWGAKMEDDLVDAVDWAVANGITTRDKVGIFGGSYGGYAVLASLAFRPDVFACGVDLFGPSNLNTLLATTPAYWAGQKAIMYRRMGDPTTPEGEALLKQRSPLFAADAIKRPLLIGQGANDARVKQAESDQVAAALQAKGIPVTYLLFADEGHGFAIPQNNLAFTAVTEQFLAKCLGGRAEPIGDALQGSTVAVKAGADLVPELAALAAK